MLFRAIFFLTFVSSVLAADLDEKPAMTKLVTRLTSEATKNDPSAARSRTLYRAGKKYSRLEEEADSDRGMHRLIIANEPDSWVINLENQTGNHYLDKGPVFKTSMPIFWGLDGKPEPDFSGLEFGEELEFFGNGHAREAGEQEVDGKKCTAFSIVSGEHEVMLYVEKKSGNPYAVELVKYGRPVASVRYLSYEKGLPFDATLFAPPKDVMVMPAEMNE